MSQCRWRRSQFGDVGHLGFIPAVQQVPPWGWQVPGLCPAPSPRGGEGLPPALLAGSGPSRSPSPPFSTLLSPALGHPACPAEQVLALSAPQSSPVSSSRGADSPTISPLSELNNFSFFSSWKKISIYFPICIACKRPGRTRNKQDGELRLGNLSRKQSFCFPSLWE